MNLCVQRNSCEICLVRLDFEVERVSQGVKGRSSHDVLAVQRAPRRILYAAILRHYTSRVLAIKIIPPPKRPPGRPLSEAPTPPFAHNPPVEINHITLYHHIVLKSSPSRSNNQHRRSGQKHWKGANEVPFASSSPPPSGFRSIFQSGRTN